MYRYTITYNDQCIYTIDIWLETSHEKQTFGKQFVQMGIAIGEGEIKFDDDRMLSTPERFAIFKDNSMRIMNLKNWLWEWETGNECKEPQEAKCFLNDVCTFVENEIKKYCTLYGFTWSFINMDYKSLI